MLNAVVRASTLTLFLILEEKLSVFYRLVVILAVGLFKYDLYYVVVSPFYSSFVKSFHYERMLHFFKYFYRINWDDRSDFYPLFCQCDISHYLVFICNHPCISRINLMSSWCIILLSLFLFGEDFCIYILSRVIGL